MGRPGEVAFLLALYLLLGIMHSTRAQYDHYDYEDYDEPDRYDFDEDEDVEEDYSQEEEALASRDAEGASEEGEPPAGVTRNQELSPMCNNENCWIRVDWEPPLRDTWMSCILGYRVGFRRPGNEWIWMNDEGTHMDQRSDKLFFFEEAEGTNHSLTIHNLDYETDYEVIIEVFNPYGGNQSHLGVTTPPGSCIKVLVHISFQSKSRRAMPGRICA